jgi:hypothetical protein
MATRLLDISDRRDKGGHCEEWSDEAIHGALAPVAFGAPHRLAGPNIGDDQLERHGPFPEPERTSR